MPKSSTETSNHMPLSVDKRFIGDINFLWYGNPMQEQYLGPAFDGPMSFLKSMQSDCDKSMRIVYWCQEQYKSEVEKCFRELIAEQGLSIKPEQLVVKSIETDLFEQLVTNGQITKEELLRIKKIIAKIESYKDYIIAKDLIAPFVLLAEGGYFFDTTTFHGGSDDHGDKIALPKLEKDFYYAYHEGSILRAHYQVDIYSFAAREAFNTRVRKFAFLHAEMYAKLYNPESKLYHLDDPQFDEFFKSAQIFNRDDFSITDAMLQKYKDWYIGVEKRGYSFVPRSCLIKKENPFAKVPDGKMDFVRYQGPQALSAAYYMDTAEREKKHCARLVFKETFNVKDLEIDLVLQNSKSKIVKKSGQTCWGYSNINAKRYLHLALAFIKMIVVKVIDFIQLLVKKVLIALIAVIRHIALSPYYLFKTSCKLGEMLGDLLCIFEEKKYKILKNIICDNGDYNKSQSERVSRILKLRYNSVPLGQVIFLSKKKNPSLKHDIFYKVGKDGIKQVFTVSDKILGKGKRGKVFNVTDDSGTEYALKVAHLGKNLVKHNYIREVEALDKLGRLTLNYVDENTQYSYILMKKEKGCNLHAYINGEDLSLDGKKELAVSLALELKKLHDLNMIHFDLHPWNVLVGKQHGESPKLSIIDFGNTVEQGASFCKDNVPSIALDIYPLTGNRHNMYHDSLRYDKSYDIFALGKIFERYDLCDKELLKLMLSFDSDKRPNIDQVISCLEKYLAELDLSDMKLAM